MSGLDEDPPDESAIDIMSDRIRLCHDRMDVLSSRLSFVMLVMAFQAVLLALLVGCLLLSY